MRLCVLLPGKDEALVIARTIQSVLDAGMASADIYVIDDGSSDGTATIARSFEGVNVLRNEHNIGKARSIVHANQTYKLSDRYDAICLMDADSIVDSDYYQKVAAAFQRKSNVAVVSANTKSIAHNWLTAYRSMIYAMSNFIYKQGQDAMGVITVVPGFAASYSAKVFAQLSWDSDTVVEDMDTTIQVHRKGLGRIVYTPEAVAYTQDPATIRDYIKQVYRWHTGAWQVGKKHKMFTGMSKIDWEFKILMLEGVIFSTFYLLLPLWLLIWPHATLVALVLETTVMMGTSLLAAAITRRWDIARYCPSFILVRAIDCSVLTYSFVATVVMGKQERSWNAVKRYAS
jgi:cellulose synthase/poly-beta-1,6-N-acetylglucosamine synthase-like glycosyltransferase